MICYILLQASGHISYLNRASTTSEPQHQVQRGFLINIVIDECHSVLELLSSKYKSLLVGRYPLLVLNLILNTLNSVVRCHIKCQCLAC